MGDSVDAVLGRAEPVPEPGTGRPRDQIAWQLTEQACACQAMGSPLYADLLVNAAADVHAGGPVWSLLGDHVAPGRADALALRFMSAVHRLVLDGRAPQLAAFYPSVGGTPQSDATWRAFRATVEQHAAEIADLLRRPCQTNEVGRAAALAVGYLEAAQRTGLPLALHEIGAAAGLNLRWDHFRYGGGGQSWGPAGSPVDLTGLWTSPPPVEGITASVAVRRGVDAAPVDPTTREGLLTLTAAVWADQPHRIARLEGAAQIARRVPAELDTGDAADWVSERVAPASGVATVLSHSVVWEYLTSAAARQIEHALARAGRSATKSAPLAWVRLEPVSALRSHGLVVTTWPGGDERVLATCGAHGSDVHAA